MGGMCLVYRDCFPKKPVLMCVCVHVSSSEGMNMCCYVLPGGEFLLM